MRVNSVETLKADLLRELLTLKQSKRLKTQGSSMEPTIPQGSWIQVQSPVFPLPIGSVVLFINERQQHVCHRVIARKDREYFIRGDAHKQGGDWVKNSLIVGQVTSFEYGLINAKLTYPIQPLNRLHRKIQNRLHWLREQGNGAS